MRLARALAQKILGFARDQRASTRRIKIVLGGALFLGVLVWSVRAVGTADLDPSPAWLLALVLLGGPVTIGIMTAEQHAATLLGGARVPLLSSFRTTLLATAANYLPIPGAVVVRVEALRRAGTPTANAVGVAAGLGVIWLAVTGCAIAVSLAIMEFQGMAIATAVAALVGLVAGTMLLGTKRSNRWLPHILFAYTIVIAKVLFHAATTYMALRAIGSDISIEQATVVSGANVLASATGFFPGGLGLREWLAGALASASGLAAAAGSLAAIVARAVMTALVALASAAVLARGWEAPDVQTGPDNGTGQGDGQGSGSDAAPPIDGGDQQPDGAYPEA